MNAVELQSFEMRVSQKALTNVPLFNKCRLIPVRVVWYYYIQNTFRVMRVLAC